MFLRMSRVLVGVCLGIILITSAAVAADASRFSRREVTFKNGDIELHGTVTVPTTAGKHAAVVFLHGSGPSTREGALPYAEEFAKMGLASLCFDKRGCGSSGGSWLRASLDDLSEDGIAAMAFLKTQAEVDASRIGLWGISQAGWVATNAATKTKDIAFMIIVSGGGASPRETEMFAYRATFKHAGLSDAETAEAFKVIDAYFGFLSTGEGREQLVKQLDASKTSAWYQYAPLDRILPSPENRMNWSWVANWDPAPAIARIECPVFLMFGDLDMNLPTDVAVKQWRDGLNAAGNKDVTIMVFPGAAHGIRMGEHDARGRAPFAPGYSESMLGWLWQHVIEGEK